MNKKLALLAHNVQAQELNRLAEMLGEVHDDTGEAVPDWLVHYGLGRREQLIARIATLRTSITERREH